MMRLKSLPGRSRFSLIDRIKLLKKTSPDGGSRTETLEDILIAADAGVKTTAKILAELGKDHAGENLLPVLRDRMLEVFAGRNRGLNMNSSGLTVMMIAGVNGSGKTTTIGKLAHMFVKQGKKVLVSASDTFRAGAVEQLEIWAKRAGAGVVRHDRRAADPSAVAYDAVEAAVARGMDILLVDTAGRLHTRTNLMEELKKVKNVIGRRVPGAPHEVMLILDAATGQNAMAQADIFLKAVEITSIGLAKLDGTARGRIVLAIEDAFGIPVKIICTGEGIEDMDFFKPDEFVEAMLS